MNKSIITIILIFWMLMSLCLVCSTIGMLLFIRSDFDNEYSQGDKGISSWLKFGHKLLDKI